MHKQVESHTEYPADRHARHLRFSAARPPNETRTEHMPSQRMSTTSGISKPNTRSKLRLSSRSNSRSNPRPNSSAFRKRATMPIAKRNPELADKIAQMRLKISPIVHIATGEVAPDFPDTMLQLFCLTEDQLDAMAAYYSQISPDAMTHQYPCTMDWSKPFLCKDASLPTQCKLTELERLKVKMRMFARFIGMRGADTPNWEYERQMEIMHNKIRRSIVEEEKEEERVVRKIYRRSGWVP